VGREEVDVDEVPGLEAGAVELLGELAGHGEELLVGGPGDGALEGDGDPDDVGLAEGDLRVHVEEGLGVEEGAGEGAEAPGAEVHGEGGGEGLQAGADGALAVEHVHEGLAEALLVGGGLGEEAEGVDLLVGEQRLPLVDELLVEVRGADALELQHQLPEGLGGEGLAGEVDDPLATDLAAPVAAALLVDVLLVLEALGEVGGEALELLLEGGDDGGGGGDLAGRVGAAAELLGDGLLLLLVGAQGALPGGLQPLERLDLRGGGAGLGEKREAGGGEGAKLAVLEEVAEIGGVVVDEHPKAPLGLLGMAYVRGGRGHDDPPETAGWKPGRERPGARAAARGRGRSAQLRGERRSVGGAAGKKERAPVAK
jgi:hypothetical protein